MALYIGDTTIEKITLGSLAVEKAALGSDVAYEQGAVSDPNTILLLHFDEDLRDSSVSQCDVLDNPSYTLRDTGKFGKAIRRIEYGGPHAKWMTKYGQSFDVSDSYTIEYWTYINVDQTYNSKGRIALSTSNYSYVKTGSGKATLYWYGHPTSGSTVITNYITNNSWNHICIQFVNYDFFRIYVNGVIVKNYDSYAISGNKIPDFGNKVGTGGNLTYSDGCQILVDEFRLSNIARYDKDGFTVPDSPFPSYDPSSYHSKLKNCVEVGSLTENNYEYSGFNPSKFVSLNQPLNPENKTWEVNMKLTTGSNVTDYQALFHSGFARNLEGRRGIGLAVEENKFNFFVSNDGTSWFFDDYSPAIITANTTYKIKFGFNGSEYYLDDLTSGQDTRLITVNSNLGAYSPLIFTNIGAYQKEIIKQCFEGSIDMSQTSVTVDGVTTNFI